MPAPLYTVVPISNPSDVGAARRMVAQLAEAAKMSATACGKAAIITTELANNSARYAKNARLLISVVPSLQDKPPAFEILAVDRGPGMAHIEQCLSDGYSTGGTPGNGLGAVRRMSDEFDVHSSAATGTVIFSCVVDATPGKPLRSQGAFKWAGLSLTAPKEAVSGDTWAVSERDGRLTVMMTDGLGHGPAAHDAARAAAGAFWSSADQPPQAVIRLAHQQLAGTRGAAMAVASVADGRITFAGVGNICATVQALEGSHGLMSHNGIVGSRLLKVVEIQIAWPSDGLFILHSDGLSARWRLSDWPGLSRRHPAVVAAALLQGHQRPSDDATVLVIRRAGN